MHNCLNDCLALTTRANTSQPIAPGQVHVDVTVMSSQSYHTSPLPSSPLVDQVTTFNSENVVRRYESKDPVTGRVWGMPNAGGRGQCFQCHQRAAPPSRFCVSCQMSEAQRLHEVMPENELRFVRESFNGLLECYHGNAKLKGDVAGRLSLLHAELQAGKIAQSVQAKLLEISRALTVKDFEKAHAVCAALVSEYWEKHRHWLIGVKQLVSIRIQMH
eukprot:TRINITY_DN34444_c1_g1_i1.p1 TRINITY_DN34444_c1_g1~~TRINITY_DN34444_c1_g1_i1.p1  ORF type:complete len:254 (-),score=22.97 TRINITY_DN34444_c1_g1_i1:32-682(-)